MIGLVITLSDDAPAQEAARSAGPGTGVFSTAADLAKFYAMAANCGTVPGGRQITAPMSMRE